MRVPEMEADRSGVRARRSAKMATSKVAVAIDAPAAVIRQQLVVARRFNLSPAVAALIASLAFTTMEARI